MSSTRRSDSNKAISFERYMSAPEFADLRPIPGNVVLAKAMLYSDAKTRELAFFLQAMSMQNGGLRAVAARIVELFPDNCREDENSHDTVTRKYVATFAGNAFSLSAATVDNLSEYLVELAINPKLSLSKIECPCFVGLAEALRKFKTEWEAGALRDFVVTSSGRVVMDTLDQALRISRMVVIEGNAGAGKSTNAKAWCAARPGRVRYVSLSGINSRTMFFQKIAASIGLATCQRKAIQLQSKIEDFFMRSRMMLVIDEAHYLWPQMQQVRSAPELVDWVDTALVNQGVPVALLCTDQFSKLKSRVERATGWTSEQFQHRVYRYRQLPAMPIHEDVEAVTRRLLSAVWDEGAQQWKAGKHQWDAATVEALVLYALEQKIPFSCVSSCIDEARATARDAGRVIITKSDVKRSFASGQIPSDAALKRAFGAPADRRHAASRAAPSNRKPSKAYVSLPDRGDSSAALGGSVARSSSAECVSA